MPPKRKSATRSASQQSTLTFNGKANRVTKSSQQQQNTKGAGGKTKRDPALEEDVVRTELNASAEPDIEAPTTADVAIADEAEKALGEPLQTGVKVEDVLGGRAAQSETGATGGAAGVGWVGDEEEKARRVSDAQVKKYWKKKEEARIVPRVHQEGLSLEEKVLREWDMSGQYGPCIGIARLKRWKRANVLGLDPPIEVLAVLLKEMGKGEAGAKMQRAHVDELMSSRFVET